MLVRRINNFLGVLGINRNTTGTNYRLHIGVHMLPMPALNLGHIYVLHNIS